MQISNGGPMYMSGEADENLEKEWSVLRLRFGPGVSQIEVKSVNAGDTCWWSEWWFSKTPWSHRHKYWHSNPDPLQHNQSCECCMVGSTCKW